jgi:hypothetical protein
VLMTCSYISSLLSFLFYLPLLASSIPLCPTSLLVWGTALQAWRLRVRFPIGSLVFFTDFYPSGRTTALGSTQPLTEMSTTGISWGEGKGCRCVGLITLPPSLAKCLEIVGASTSWSPKGLYRPAMG